MAVAAAAGGVTDVVGDGARSGSCPAGAPDRYLVVVMVNGEIQVLGDDDVSRLSSGLGLGGIVM